MTPVGFEPTISAGERPPNHTLDRAASGTVIFVFVNVKYFAKFAVQHGHCYGECYCPADRFLRRNTVAEIVIFPCISFCNLWLIWFIATLNCFPQ